MYDPITTHCIILSNIHLILKHLLILYLNIKRCSKIYVILFEEHIKFYDMTMKWPSNTIRYKCLINIASWLIEMWLYIRRDSAFIFDLSPGLLSRGQGHFESTSELLKSTSYVNHVCIIYCVLWDNHYIRVVKPFKIVMRRWCVFYVIS